MIDKHIAFCGLDCKKCEIFLARDNEKIANELAKKFEGSWENVEPSDFHCGACRSNIDECWTPDCWIRECCMNTKKVHICSECPDFPCSKLKDWASKSQRYENALNNLFKLKNEKT